MSLRPPIASTACADERAAIPRVLFVDDDPVMRRVVVRLSLVHGIEATAVATVEEMRAELPQVQPDLVVLDFNLGGGQASGGLIRELLAVGLLIVVWTGDAPTAREAIGPMTPVIPKSSDGSALFREVIRLIRARARAVAKAVESGDLGRP